MSIIVRIERKERKHQVSDLIFKGKPFDNQNKSDDFDYQAGELLKELCDKLDALHAEIELRYRAPKREPKQTTGKEAAGK